MDIANWIAQSRKGTMELAVLAILRNRRMYGVELVDMLSKHESLALTEGTLYPMMNRLKRDGLVASVWEESEYGHPRKYYSLTDEGEQTVKAMMDHWGRFVATLDILLNREAE